MAGIYPVCSNSCGYELSQKKLLKKKKAEEKERKREDKKRLDELNETIPFWTKKVQKVFNQYIRLRDEKEPCISCGNENIKHSDIGGLWDCGHYRSVGSSPELRFEELNAHRQCKYCNSYLSGNVVEYRKRLKLKIGVEALEKIESNHEPKRYRVNDLKELYKIYADKVKELKSGD
jgi:hypothetical protein